MAEAQISNRVGNYLKLTGGELSGSLTTHGIKISQNIDYGNVLPSSGTEGQLFFQISEPYYELPDGGTANQSLVKTSNNNRDVMWGGPHIVANNGKAINTLTIERITSISDDYSARLNFQVVQSDNSIINNNTFIASYDDHDAANNGTNLVIQSGGHVIIGGGESPNQLYTNAMKGQTANSGISVGANSAIFKETGEHLILTSDGNIFFFTNCNTIANRNLSYINSSGYYYGTRVYAAVWNDYAEYRKDNPKERDKQQPGRCVREVGDGTLTLTEKRLERGCEIISDTFGFAIGQDEENGYNTPIASNGRVLAYPYEDIEEFANHIGSPVCSGPDGTVSIMTNDEEIKYPSCIIGTISEIPTYEEWGTGKVKVDGRIWIRIR